MLDLLGKKVLVIGLGISGRSAAQFLQRRHAIVSAIDANSINLSTNPEVASLVKNGLKLYHESDSIDLTQFQLIVVSPGIPETNTLYAKALKSSVEVIGEVELACRYVKSTFLGITGTNGKTTVTLLVAHILNKSGKLAYALGNSGVPLTSEEAESAVAKNAIIVAELSSYQLDTLHSRIIDAAVLLNITPDHLDRYGTMQNYAKSKWHIAECLKPNGELYAEEASWNTYGDLASSIPKLYGYTKGCAFQTDLKCILHNGTAECELPKNLQGKRSHDLENLLAAYALCRYVGITPKQFLAAYATFEKPAHRIQFVTKIKGIPYYDDSKGTNIDAVIRAVNSVCDNGKVILIAGGIDKGSSYTPWIDAFAERVKCICAIGQAAPKMQQELSHAIPVRLFKSLEEAVQHAANLAVAGDVVLLSPGCSSLDMFKDYAHRGEEFQRFVKQLDSL